MDIHLLLRKLNLARSPTSFQYLTETKVKRKHVSRLGEWWKSRQVQYPLMFQVVNPRIANVAYLRHAEVCAKCGCRIFATK